MKIISVANLKGGAGKTTISTILLNELTINHGYKCLLIEADDQGSITDVRKMNLQDPLYNGLKAPYEINRVESQVLDKFLEEKKKELMGYDLILIELPGYFDAKIVNALRQCDCLLIPAIPNITDNASLIRYIAKLQKGVVDYKVQQDEEFIYFVIRNKYQKLKNVHKAFKEFLEKLGLDVMDSYLSNLEAYANGLQTMVSFTNSEYNADFEKIKDEVEKFVNEFLEKFEIETVKN